MVGFTGTTGANVITDVAYGRTCHPSGQCLLPRHPSGQCLLPPIFTLRDHMYNSNPIRYFNSLLTLKFYKFVMVCVLFQVPFSDLEHELQ